MIGAFQPKGFQGNAFQVAPVEGYIYAVDGDDTSDLQGLVTLPAGIIDTTDENDTALFTGQVVPIPQPSDLEGHDGFTKEEIRRARNLDRKIREKELALLKAQRADKEARNHRS